MGINKSYLKELAEKKRQSKPKFQVGTETETETPVASPTGYPNLGISNYFASPDRAKAFYQPIIDQRALETKNWYEQNRERINQELPSEFLRSPDYQFGFPEFEYIINTKNPRSTYPNLFPEPEFFAYTHRFYGRPYGQKDRQLMGFMAYPGHGPEYNTGPFNSLSHELSHYYMHNNPEVFLYNQKQLGNSGVINTDAWRKYYKDASDEDFSITYRTDEAIADAYSIRQEMKDKGYYDYTKGEKLTPELFQKYLQEKNKEQETTGKKDFISDRFVNLFSGVENSNEFDLYHFYSEYIPSKDSKLYQDNKEYYEEKEKYINSPIYKNRKKELQSIDNFRKIMSSNTPQNYVTHSDKIKNQIREITGDPNLTFEDEVTHGRKFNMNYFYEGAPAKSKYLQDLDGVDPGFWWSKVYGPYTNKAIPPDKYGHSENKWEDYEEIYKEIDKEYQNKRSTKTPPTKQESMQKAIDFLNSIVKTDNNKYKGVAKKGANISTEGYKRNSPDVNNPYNIIPSNQITMNGVDFPVLGIDDIGNQIMMQPGEDYTFPGSYVTEFPMKNMGNKRFAQVGMRTPIPTSDWSKVRAYQDSLDLYNKYPTPRNKQSFMTRSNTVPGWFDNQVQRLPYNNIKPIAFNLESVDRAGYHTPIYAEPKQPYIYNTTPSTPLSASENKTLSGTLPPLKQWQYMNTEEKKAAIKKYGNPNTWPFPGVRVPLFEEGGVIRQSRSQVNQVLKYSKQKPNKI